MEGEKHVRKGRRLPSRLDLSLPPAVMSSGNSTLVPNYRQVEEFVSDDEYEKDENGNIIEEVEYVTLDIGVVEPTLVPSTTSYRLIVSPTILISRINATNNVPGTGYTHTLPPAVRNSV